MRTPPGAIYNYRLALQFPASLQRPPSHLPSHLAPWGGLFLESEPDVLAFLAAADQRGEAPPDQSVVLAPALPAGPGLLACLLERVDTLAHSLARAVCIAALRFECLRVFHFSLFAANSAAFIVSRSGTSPKIESGVRKRLILPRTHPRPPPRRPLVYALRNVRGLELGMWASSGGRGMSSEDSASRHGIACARGERGCFAASRRPHRTRGKGQTPGGRSIVVRNIGRSTALRWKSYRQRYTRKKTSL